MTPQEQELVADLFDRLATLEGQRRDPDAERLIREGLGRAPNAVYTLVQSVLVQDEALKRANARIEELEHGAAESQPPQGGFLDSMRNALLGERPRGSVPSVRPGAQPSGPTGGQGSSGVWNSGQPGGYASPMGSGPTGGGPMGAGMPMGPGMGMGSGMGSGSFLGTAAATVAGVIGGGLMLDGIRSMMGGHHGFIGDHQRFQSDPGSSPWDTAGGGGALGHDLGTDDISGHRTSAYDDASANYASSAGDDQAGDDDGGYDDSGDDGDGGDFGGNDSDSA
jgi:uncharacterized protein